MNNDLLQPTQMCPKCNEQLILKQQKRNRDELGSRCFKSGCLKYGTWVQIRRNSFFECTIADLKQLLKSIYYWFTGLQQYEILNFVTIKKTCLQSLKKRLIKKINLFYDINPIKLGGPGIVVQVDETMINHKVKAHRERTPVCQQQTEALNFQEPLSHILKIKMLLS